jgi:hypothetical protein
LIIDKWIKDWDIYYSGTIYLEAGKKYDIKVEYFEEVGGANIKLEWASSQTPREIISSSQFYLPNFTTSGLEQIPSLTKDELIIYPNPVVSKLYIDYNNKTVKSVTIANSDGRILYYNDNSFNTNIPIDVSNIARGMYFLVVLNSQNEKVVSKFVKQ